MSFREGNKMNCSCVASNDVITNETATGETVIVVIVASSDTWSNIYDTLEARNVELEARFSEITKTMAEIKNPPLWSQNYDYLPPRSFSNQCTGKRLNLKCRT
jgi:hypothetical protein